MRVQISPFQYSVGTDVGKCAHSPQIRRTWTDF